MKVFAVALLCVLGFAACRSTGKEEEASVPSSWDGGWVLSVNGIPLEGFEEIKLIIEDDQVTVKQGSTDIWVGTFNTTMPTDDDYEFTSVRDPEANLPYTPASIETRQFSYSKGVLTYIEEADMVFEFVKRA